MTKGNNSDPGEIDPEELQHQLAHMGAPLTPNVVNRGVGVVFVTDAELDADPAFPFASVNLTTQSMVLAIAGSALVIWNVGALTV